METRAAASGKRWIAILIFLLFDFLMIFVIAHIDVAPDDNGILRYVFRWTPTLNIDIGTLVVILVLPFVISYITSVGSIARNRKMVQIIGSKSLMRRVEMEFHKGNPGGKEYTPENVKILLSELSENEPPGTFENLEMLFSMGVIVKELLEKAKTKSVKRVYISDDLIPNAFTLRVIPLPFIGQDWIIINRNVIDILDQREIQAVIAHEIGHAVRRDSWINSLLYSPRLVIIFGWATILAAMAAIILENLFSIDTALRLIGIMLLFIIIRFLMNIGTIFTSYAYRKTELLADYYAARLVGPETLINALIKIGQRGEVIKAINIELEWINKQFRDPDISTISRQILYSLDPSETSKERARENTLRLYATQRLVQTFNGLRLNFTQQQIDDLVQQACNNLSQERGFQVEQERATMRLGTNQLDTLTKDWQSVDFDKNQKLDADEIKVLVEEIQSGDKRIFETEALERIGVLSSPRTHPQVSTRITFLYDNLISE